jgi:hypothetical protein
MVIIALWPPKLVSCVPVGALRVPPGSVRHYCRWPSRQSAGDNLSVGSTTPAEKTRILQAEQIKYTLSVSTKPVSHAAERQIFQVSVFFFIT